MAETFGGRGKQTAERSFVEISNGYNAVGFPVESSERPWRVDGSPEIRRPWQTTAGLAVLFCVLFDTLDAVERSAEEILGLGVVES
jgi:hypothetical protein